MQRIVLLRRIGLLLVVLAFLAVAAQAEVVAADAGGFVVRQEATVPLGASELFTLLTEKVSVWWDGSHSFSGDSANLYFDLDSGGCFCERLPAGGWVRHLEVVFVDPPRRLGLRGGLGPLLELGVAGAMTWRLEEVEGGTRLSMVYGVSGYQPDGLAGWAGAVDGVLGLQFERLVRLATTGSL